MSTTVFVDGATIKNGTVYVDDKAVNGLVIKSYTVTKTATPFKAYKVMLANRHFIDMSFTRACKNVPYTGDGEGLYIMLFENDSDISLDTNRLYPRLYVRNCIGIIPYTANFKAYYKI